MNLKIRRILGYLGLIPFVSFLFIPLLVPFPEGYVFNLLLSFYGGIILSFLGGITWGWSENENQKFSLVIGIFFSLIGFFIVAFSNMFLYYCLWLGLISFVAFFFFELNASAQMRNREYRVFRGSLTFLVAICYLGSLATFNW